MRLRFIPASHWELTGAKVVNDETGEEIEEVAEVRYEHVAGHPPKLTVVVHCNTMPRAATVEGDMVAEGTMTDNHLIRPISYKCPECGGIFDVGYSHKCGLE